ncbi:MAG: hypothetical protein P9L93_03770 [Candidatus Gorgyraea atricola]|nr:hypothetical protein [Candidatus Gorgyraea atricola]
MRKFGKGYNAGIAVILMATLCLSNGLVYGSDVGYLRKPLISQQEIERVETLARAANSDGDLIQYESSDNYVGLSFFDKKILIDRRLYQLFYTYRMCRTSGSTLDFHLWWRKNEYLGEEIYGFASDFNKEIASLSEEEKWWKTTDEHVYLSPENAVFLHPPYVLQLIDLLRMLDDNNESIEDFVEDHPADVLDLGNDKFWILQGQNRTSICFAKGKRTKAKIVRIKSDRKEFLDYLKKEAFSVDPRLLQERYMGSLAANILSWIAKLKKGYLDHRMGTDLLHMDINNISKIAKSPDHDFVTKDIINGKEVIKIDFPTENIIELCYLQNLVPSGYLLDALPLFYKVISDISERIKVGQDFYFADTIFVKESRRRLSDDKLKILYLQRKNEVLGTVVDSKDHLGVKDRIRIDEFLIDIIDIFISLAAVGWIEEVEFPVFKRLHNPKEYPEFDSFVSVQADKWVAVAREPYPASYNGDKKDWEKVQSVDLKSLPIGTLVYMKDSETWVSHMVEIVKGGFIKLWVNQNNGCFVGPPRLLNIEGEEKTVLKVHKKLGFPYFRWDNKDNLLEFDPIESGDGGITDFSDFYILYPKEAKTQIIRTGQKMFRFLKSFI